MLQNKLMKNSSGPTPLFLSICYVLAWRLIYARHDRANDLQIKCNQKQKYSVVIYYL